MTPAGDTVWQRLTVPPGGLPYPLALQTSDADRPYGPQRVTALIGLALALSLFTLVVPLINVVVQGIGYVIDGAPGTFTSYLLAGARFDTVAGLVGAHLGLGSLTLIVMGLLRYLHRRRPEWLWSVSPGMRWRYLLLCLPVALVLLNLAFVLTNPVPGWKPQANAVVFIIAIVLTAPLQALGEEVFFRGYLTQGLGLVVHNTWFAIVVSALIFALFHGTQNSALFFNRFAFGVIAGVLVWRTGGLEAAIAAHVANNVSAFFWAALTGSVAATRAIQQVTWASTAADIAGFAAVAAACWVIATRMKVPWRTPDPAIGLSADSQLR